MSEILLYGTIYSSSAEAFINALNDNGDNDLSVRINSEGGSPEYGWGMVAKFSEATGKKRVKVDGKAHSMAAYFLCYADDVEVLDVAQILLHRAAYPEWIESNDSIMTQSMKDSLTFINKKLRAALEAKVDVAKFEKIKGITMDQLFSLDSRIEVMLTAAEAKKMGLVNRVVNITPEKTAQIKSEMERIAAHAQGLPYQIAAEQEKPNSIMDIAKLKAEHPALYAEVFNLGKTEGISLEKDRVEACLVYAEVDMPGVKAAIESGKSLSAKQISDFMMKVASGRHLEGIAADSGENKEVKTEEVKNKEKNAETEAKAKVDAFEASVRSHLNIATAK
jgi:ATP-dependent protease ClpP protease subunit